MKGKLFWSFQGTGEMEPQLNSALHGHANCNSCPPGGQGWSCFGMRPFFPPSCDIYPRLQRAKAVAVAIVQERSWCFWSDVLKHPQSLMAPNAARKKMVNHSGFLLVVLFMVPTICMTLARLGPMQMFSDLEQNIPWPCTPRPFEDGYGSEASGHSLAIKTFKTPNILSSHLERSFMDDVISQKSTIFQGP